MNVQVFQQRKAGEQIPKAVIVNPGKCQLKLFQRRGFRQRIQEENSKKFQRQITERFTGRKQRPQRIRFGHRPEVFIAVREFYGLDITAGGDGDDIEETRKGMGVGNGGRERKLLHVDAVVAAMAPESERAVDMVEEIGVLER